MARIRLATRDQILEKERPAYDAFMLSRANRPNIGPYSLLLHMPEVAQRLEALRTYIRSEASLPQKLQELVMISVAREMAAPSSGTLMPPRPGRREYVTISWTVFARSTRWPTSIPRSKPWWTSPASFFRTARSAGLPSMPPRPDSGNVGP